MLRRAIGGRPRSRRRRASDATRGGTLVKDEPVTSSKRPTWATIQTERGIVIMEHDLRFEAAYWGDCTNTFDEERKHYVYARCMALDRQDFSFDVHDRRILDIGGGPASILLKTVKLKEGKVCDPLRYPGWVYERYKV